MAPGMDVGMERELRLEDPSVVSADRAIATPAMTAAAIAAAPSMPGTPDARPSTAAAAAVAGASAPATTTEAASADARSRGDDVDRG